jgi:septal ring factor EnvC (AmiA/AmiB activator)
LSERISISSGSTITIGVVITVIVAVVGGAVKITSDRAQMQSEIDVTRRDIVQIMERISPMTADGNRITRLEAIYSAIEQKLSRIETKLEKIDEQIARLPR